MIRTFHILCILIFFLIPCQIHSQLNLDRFILQSKYDIINNNYIAAIENLNKVIKVKSDDFEAYFLRGIAKFNLGDYLGADQDFSTSVSINPFYANSYHYLAIAKDRQYEYDEAFINYDKALEFDPFNPEIFLNRGISNSMIQNYDEAIENYNKALKLHPNYETAYLARGTTFGIQKKYDKAEKDLNKAIQMNPFNADAFSKRGWVKYEEENYKEAIQDFDQAIKINSTRPFFYFSRALAQYQNSEFDLALKDFNKVLELDPKNSLTYYNRAILFTETGAYNKAIADYNKVLENNPYNIITYYNRAGIKLQLKDYKGAIQDFSKAIEVYPDFASAYLNRAYAKSQLEDDKGAYADQMKAKKIIQKYQSKDIENKDLSYADTSINYNKIIEIDADFENKTPDQAKKTGRIQNLEVSIDIKPNYTVLVNNVVKYESYIPTFLPSIESFNKESDITLQLTSFYNYELDTTRDLHALIDSMDAIIDADPNDKTYIIRGLYNYYIQNFNKSIQDISRAIDLDSDNELYYFLRATINDAKLDFINSFEDMNLSLSLNAVPILSKSTDVSFEETEKIMDDYNTSIELNPGFAYAYYNRGNSKCKARDFWGAIQDYSKSIELNNDLPEAYYNRGLTQIYLNDIQKACMDLSSAGQLGVYEAYNVIKRYCKEEADLNPDVKVEE